MNTLQLTQPDDMHVHFRDHACLTRTVAETAKTFARAIVMPNLTPPVTDKTIAAAYRERIIKAIPANHSFSPLLAIYLTEQTSKQTIIDISQTPWLIGCKFYPAGATTNSQFGVKHVTNIYPLLETLQEYHVPLLIHGEIADDACDVFEREQRFIDDVLAKIINQFPTLRIVLEHISTREAVECIQSTPKHIAATITAHHLLYNRNALLAGKLRPHYYCAPILKHQKHQNALCDAIVSSNPKFFLGSDSAPHSESAKLSACGCAGVFTAHAALEFYAEVFEQLGVLDKLEAFSSFYAADFYGLPRNTKKITLTKKAWTVPTQYSLGDDHLIPLRAGELIHWSVEV
jgi:dihydroorotase